MWRYLAGAAAGFLLVVAGMMLQATRPSTVASLAAMPTVASEASAQDAAAAVPEASAKTREEKRFNRYDKDRDGSITRIEYLTPRTKGFAKLDANHDGTLSFDEWAVKAETKFASADADKSGAMNASEFATTAVKRKSRPATPCAPGKPTSDEAKDEDS